MFYEKNKMKTQSLFKKCGIMSLLYAINSCDRPLKLSIKTLLDRFALNLLTIV